jgi:hypothetical protein
LGLGVLPLTEYYFSKFKPFGAQRKVLNVIYNHDYSLHTPEILQSGSVGSAKSAVSAHAAVSHCLRWPRAQGAISRMGLPDLRRTIYKEIKDHLEQDPNLIPGLHYRCYDQSCNVKFANGSEILGVTFGDREWGKVKSLTLSFIIFEELTEFPDEFFKKGGGFMLFKARLRRLAHVPENWLLANTNPGEPGSPVHKYFIEGSEEFDSRYVFYSDTESNKYLDPIYINQLKQDYSFLEAERYLRGKWISLFGKGIYHAFSDKNVVKKRYEIDKYEPIYISFDFNIGHGKPLSSIAYQYINGIFHFFAESVIHGAYTYEGVDDFYNREIINPKHCYYIIQGDATGKARDPSSKLTNYDVIEEYLGRRFIRYELDVPTSNPPIRERHSRVNAQSCNDANQVRAFFYEKTVPTAIQGLKLTKLKEGANFVEDDSAEYQHISTAIGYGICATLETANQKKQGTVYL